jgi:hypothetical protein
MAGSSTKISFPQLTEKHDCDHAASATIVIILIVPCSFVVAAHLPS